MQKIKAKQILAISVAFALTGILHGCVSGQEIKDETIVYMGTAVALIEE